MRERRRTAATREALRCAIVGAALVTLACSSTDPTAPIGTESAPIPLLDAGELVVGVAGAGTFGYDPRSGSQSAEFPAGQNRHVFGALGLWLSAVIDGEIRSTITQRATEYSRGTPGSDPADPRFRVFKVAHDDPDDAVDVVEWPDDLGAPVTAAGDPNVPLDGQIMWNVYNDANRDQHRILRGTGLGAEVRRTLKGFASPVILRRAVHVRWEITNRSVTAWSDLLLGFYADAELGGGFDDLCGSDSTRAMGFVYNANDLDTTYGSDIPAAGIGILSVTSPSGAPVDLSFNSWVNGEDPDTEGQARNLLTSRTFSGTPLGTRFRFAGDPTTTPPSGAIDPASGDKRMMLVAGPIDVAVGETVVLEGLVIASRLIGDKPRIDSLRQLRLDYDAASAVLARR